VGQRPRGTTILGQTSRSLHCRFAEKVGRNLAASSRGTLLVGETARLRCSVARNAGGLGESVAPKPVSPIAYGTGSGPGSRWWMSKVIVPSRQGALESDRPALLPPFSLARGPGDSRLACRISSIEISCCGQWECGLSSDQRRRERVP
jgi:hypothetical protein